MYILPHVQRSIIRNNMLHAGQVHSSGNEVRAKQSGQSAFAQSRFPTSRKRQNLATHMFTLPAAKSAKTDFLSPGFMCLPYPFTTTFSPIHASSKYSSNLVNRVALCTDFVNTSTLRIPKAPWIKWMRFKGLTAGGRMSIFSDRVWGRVNCDPIDSGRVEWADDWTM